MDHYHYLNPIDVVFVVIDDLELITIRLVKPDYVEELFRAVADGHDVDPFICVSKTVEEHTSNAEHTIGSFYTVSDVGLHRRGDHSERVDLEVGLERGEPGHWNRNVALDLPASDTQFLVPDRFRPHLGERQGEVGSCLRKEC